MKLVCAPPTFPPAPHDPSGLRVMLYGQAGSPARASAGEAAYLAGKCELKGSREPGAIADAARGQHRNRLEGFDHVRDQLPDRCGAAHVATRFDVIAGCAL